MHLLITVRLHDGRYHGAGRWPPSPARLFQALVAGAGLCGPISEEDSKALTWLEGCPPPIVGAPVVCEGQHVKSYMPNNDLDLLGGDLRRLPEIRKATKTFRPRILDDGGSLLYAWPLGPNEGSQQGARQICALAESVYQLGRGVDMAWAMGEILEDAELGARLSSFPGRVYRPSTRGAGDALACPYPSSLDSLKARHAATIRRVRPGVKRDDKGHLSQPPPPRFKQVAYDSSPAQFVYDLRTGSIEADFVAWPVTRVPELVEHLRDGVIDRLRLALPEYAFEIERGLLHRGPDGAHEGSPSARVRIIPLPSIGHPYADGGVRRVLVEVPSGCPLRANDVDWACSGLSIAGGRAGTVVLTRAADESMFLQHYAGPEKMGYRVWRTVTPAALPTAPAQMEPARGIAEVASGSRRVAEQALVAKAVIMALRNIDIRSHAERIGVQREPFERSGVRAEAFVTGPAFESGQLWHVEITFASPISGPLVIGDGRFLGLGVMAPLTGADGLHVFEIGSGLVPTADPAEVARALRRAVMARVQATLGARMDLPPFFTGHERDGAPARSDCSPHLAFSFDPQSKHLLLVAPHALDRRFPSPDEKKHMVTLEQALDGFRELRAGSAGHLVLRRMTVDRQEDPLFAASRTWESVTPYQVTRHAKDGAAESLSADLRAECHRHGLPEPHVTPLELRGVPQVGLVGRARLEFKVAIKGPVLLGRSRHHGGGLFVAVS